jgi:hypothetical protein
MDSTRISLSHPTPGIALGITLRLAAVTVLALAPLESSGQSAAVGRAPTFPARVEVIRLSLSVTDGHNRLITGLTEGEFAIFEDGIKQDLAYFTQDPLPLSVALLVDCSASMEQKLPVAQEAASRFIRTLREGDLGQVVQFNERPTVLQDFTADHDALERAIRSTRASGPTALYMSLYVSLQQLRSQYTVGYVSRNDRRDGRWRRVVVRTPSREDLQVRHKLGYYAAKG